MSKTRAGNQMLGGMTQEERSGAYKILRSMIHSLRNDDEGGSQR